MLTSDLIPHLDAYLEIARYDDRSNNGLQVQGAARIERIAFAVDACAASIDAAANAGAQMLIVHHGLFWSEHLQITDAHYKRVRALLDANLNLYAAHIPLDAHAEVGNNIQLARMAGLSDIAPWGRHHKDTIGFIGNLPQPTDVQALRRRLERRIGQARHTRAARKAASSRVTARCVASLCAAASASRSCTRLSPPAPTRSSRVKPATSGSRPSLNNRSK